MYKSISTTLSLIEKCTLPSNAHVCIMYYNKITKENINLITFISYSENNTTIEVRHNYSEEEADNIICTIHYA